MRKRSSDIAGGSSILSMVDLFFGVFGGVVVLAAITSAMIRSQERLRNETYVRADLSIVLRTSRANKKYCIDFLNNQDFTFRLTDSTGDIDIGGGRQREGVSVTSTAESVWPVLAVAEDASGRCRQPWRLQVLLWAEPLPPGNYTLELEMPRGVASDDDEICLGGTIETASERVNLSQDCLRPNETRPTAKLAGTVEVKL